MGYTRVPLLSVASEYCSHTESLYLLLALALIRTQTWYGVFAAALNDTSK